MIVVVVELPFRRGVSRCGVCHVLCSLGCTVAQGGADGDPWTRDVVGDSSGSGSGGDAERVGPC